MESLLPKVLGNISGYLMKYRAVSAEELMWEIDQEVDSLAEDDKKRLEKQLEGDVKQMIFDGITGKIRLSVFSPDMHVQLNYLGEVFYTPPTHKYMPDELERGFKRLANLRFPMVSRIVEDAVKDLMRKSGYEISDIQSEIQGAGKTIKAVKDNHELHLFIFPSIVFIAEILEALKGVTAEHIVVVPSEKSPAPFVNFIRENIDKLKENVKMMIWVANSLERTISPFMGTPKDKEIWKNLKDPERSLKASQNWIKGAVRSKVLDEDF
ncbi:MAG: hypothetical protein C4549_03010 [Deltaproteobacteria bacterium]|jgi:hypothetical protein|nr:MAG: hypothetical protein C4549_03010 [Deltaproteobacteria bacterium]